MFKQISHILKCRTAQHILRKTVCRAVKPCTHTQTDCVQTDLLVLKEYGRLHKQEEAVVLIVLLRK